MANITTENLLAAYEKKGYKLYSDGSLNIIGVRCTNEITDLWDDVICDMWMENGQWKLEIMQATTKPGAWQFDTHNFPNVNGVVGSALVKEGQYHSVWHYVPNGHFNHDALMQFNPITIDRIQSKQYTNSKMIEQTGMFGIDNHSVWNAPLDYVYPTVHNWSEGCCVIAKQSDMLAHVGRIENNVVAYGNSFSYTLFNIADLQQNMA
jgi:hypothetical protein